MADYISVREEFDADFYTLEDRCWSGALDTLKDIRDAGVEDEFMDHLSEVFFDEVPELTEVNDYIWFERDDIYEACGLDENGKREDLDSVKANLDLYVYQVNDEGIDDNGKYVDVWVSDTNIDFDIYITFKQPIDGGEITSEVSDYSVSFDSDIFDELGEDAEVVDEATDIARAYLEETGYIVDGNLVVEE